MATYVLLSKLTSKGLQTLHKKPDRLAHVNIEIRDQGYRVIAQYATLGPYDFVTVVDADDNASVAALSEMLGSRGTVTITTLPAMSLNTLFDKLSGAEQMGRAEKGEHAQFFDPAEHKWT